MKKRTKKNLRTAGSIFGKTVLAVVFCFLLHAAFNTFAMSAQTVEGYKYYSERVESADFFAAMYDTEFMRYDYYEADQSGRKFVLVASYRYNYETHRFEYSKELTDAVRLERPEYVPSSSDSSQTTSTGETTSTESTAATVPATYWQPVYGGGEGMATTLGIVSQILGIVVLGALVWTPLWKIGDKASNAAEFRKKKGDPLRGLKIGLLSSVPFGLMVIGLFVSKLTGLFPHFITWYRMAAMCFSPINNALTDGIAYTELMTWWMIPVAVLCWAVVPLLCWLAYASGFYRWSFVQRLMYKKK